MARLALVPRQGRLTLYQFDEHYVARLRAGDPATERHFIDYFGELIRIKLRRRMRQPQGIDDIRQETFLRVFRTLRAPDGLRHAERLGAFVNAVCTNVMLEHLRAGGRHPQVAEDAPEMPDQAPSIEDALARQQQRAQVRRTIEALPSEKDQRLMRAVLEERDKDEVCAELGVDRAYLRVLLHRAKQQFKARYDAGGSSSTLPPKVRRFAAPPRAQ